MRLVAEAAKSRHKLCDKVSQKANHKYEVLVGSPNWAIKILY